ncbi:MAG: signal peptidase II [Ruminococcus sp.]|nr:signal peptidase II [Ruminococcus sp.]
MAVLILLLIFTAVLVGADQLIKYWAVHTLQPKGSMEFIHFGKFRILDLTYLENDGALFGSMSGQRWFLVGFTTLAMIALAVFIVMTRKRSRLLTISATLVFAGGIGNIIDRYRQGYVVDMFEIKLFRFAIFNFADICVTVGMALLIIYCIFIEPKIQKAKEAEAVKAASDE